MPGFLRVRAAKGVKHEFYAPADWVAAHPDVYKVLDSEPVSEPGPVVHVVGKTRVKAPVTISGKTTVAAGKSVGNNEKGGAA